MIKVAGVVIAYFPDFSKLIFNIDTYIDNLEQLFIVFNSPVSPDEVSLLQSKYTKSKVQLIINQKNTGIASALNHVALKVANLGFDWLLTMDQDSYFQNDAFFKLFEVANKQKVAIFSPNAVIALQDNSKEIGETEEILCTITSGNLINLEIWKLISGFEEKLFIDEVDNDYCLKAVSNGFKIIRFNNVHLVHKLGEIKEVSFLFKKYTIITHPPIRAYYIFRNNLFIFHKYKKTFPKFVRSRKIVLLKVFIKILVFSKKRIQIFRFILAGIRDYYNNSYGSYE